MRELFFKSLFRCIRKIESYEMFENIKSLYYAVLELCLSFKMIQLFEPSLNKICVNQTGIDIEKIYDFPSDPEGFFSKPEIQFLCENIGQLKNFFVKYEKRLKSGFPY